jgi:hypothetical protein
MYYKCAAASERPFSCRIAWRKISLGFPPISNASNASARHDYDIKNPAKRLAGLPFSTDSAPARSPSAGQRLYHPRDPLGLNRLLYELRRITPPHDALSGRETALLGPTDSTSLDSGPRKTAVLGKVLMMVDRELAFLPA